MRIFLPTMLMVLAFLSACTIEQKDGELQSEFHPPLTYAQWELDNYTTQSGEPVCLVTSGYSGLSVLSRIKSGVLSILIKGNRSLPPGGNFSINANGEHFETSQEYFSVKESVAIAEALSAGEKAYLEWSEVHPHHGRLRTSNIVKLEGFASKFEQCKRSLLGKAKR